MELEARLIELETKIAYQDKIIEELNDVVYKQDKQIVLLEKNYELLKLQIQSLQNGDGDIRDHEKPPHY